MPKAKKISLEHAKELVQQGLMTPEGMEAGQRNGLIAGEKRKESWVLNGSEGLITLSFPSPKVNPIQKRKLEELPEKVQRVARTFKQVLAERIRPIYEEVREEFATKL
jgi:hypothetical protein